MRYFDPYTVVVINMFKKNQNIQQYIDKPVEIVNDEEVIKGKLQSSFGTTGKIKVIFDVNL